MLNKRIVYIVLWHIGFLVLYLIGLLFISNAEDFNHLNVHLLNVCALCSIIMVLTYQFFFTASFHKRIQYYHRALLINFGVIILLYIAYLGFYSWLFVDYLINREEHLYFGLRDLHHLFEVKENMLHIGFFALMVYSAIIYFFNFYIIYSGVKKMPSSMQRKAFYKVYYNPIMFGLLISSMLFAAGYFVMHVQGIML